VYKITFRIEPLVWIHEHLNSSVCRDAPRGFSKEYRVPDRDVDGDYPFFRSHFSIALILHQVHEKQLLVNGSCYNVRAVRVEDQLNAMELRRGFHDIYIDLNGEFYLKIS